MTFATDIIPPQAAMDAASVGFQPGIYPGMPRNDYDSAPGISHTMLKAYDRGAPAKRTVGMAKGIALECLVEDKARFFSTYHNTGEDFDRRTTDGKKKSETYARETGKIPFTKKEWDHLNGMYKAMLNHDVGHLYINSTCTRQMAIFTKIGGNAGGNANSKILADHDILMKGIIDLDGTYLWDLKTVGWPDPGRFKDSIVEYGYDSQAALYRELYAATHGGIYKPFKWLCVSTQTNEVWVEECTPYMLASGLRWVNTVLNRYVAESKTTKE